jgi:uncharacterized protein
VQGNTTLKWDTEVIADHVRFATSPGARIRGLMRAPGLDERECLIIEPARQIHTFGMRFPIDAIFCSRDWTVVHVVRGIKPRRVTRWVLGARRVIELRADSVPAGVVNGARLTLEDQGTSSSPVK